MHHRCGKVCRNPTLIKFNNQFMLKARNLGHIRTWLSILDEDLPQMSQAIARIFFDFALSVLLPTAIVTVEVAKTPYFTPVNLVAAVSGCGVHGGTFTNLSHGTVNGTPTSSVGGCGNDQGCPFTLFQ
jgi:hypothetical protein